LLPRSDRAQTATISKRLGWSRHTVNQHAARIRCLALQLAVE
jgi:DNA-binding CsgD family transcriptional regulator